MIVIIEKNITISERNFFPGDVVGLMQPDAERLILSGDARLAPPGTLLRRAAVGAATHLTECVTPPHPVAVSKKTKPENDK